MNFFELKKILAIFKKKVTLKRPPFRMIENYQLYWFDVQWIVTGVISKELVCTPFDMLTYVHQRRMLGNPQISSKSIFFYTHIIPDAKVSSLDE